MKTIRTLLLILFCSLSLLSVWSCEKRKEAPSPLLNNQKVLYQCPMHPQIVKDHPGTCPICGMDLVEIEGENGHPDPGNEATSASSARVVRIDPALAQNIGLRTEKISRQTLESTLRLNGRVTAEEDRIFSITSRVAGYVEVLHASVSGQTVKRGETLLELYSPEVVVTQERLLQSSESVGDPASQESRARLLNWDVPASFINRVEKTQQVQRRFPLLSPASGIVLRKNILLGQAVVSGTELFQIADLSEVWVTARLYQPDLAWVKPGTSALVRFRNLPGRDFESTVFFISPELDAVTRTAEIRIRLKNTSAMDLRPEMFGEILLRAAPGEPAVAIPSQALIRTGGRDVAIVSLGGNRFQPREVRIGREAGPWIEILGGLEEGEEIVVSAQFLIDSESNLRAAISQLQGNHKVDSTSGETGAQTHEQNREEVQHVH